MRRAGKNKAQRTPAVVRRGELPPLRVARTDLAVALAAAREARRLIADIKHWTRGHGAVNRHGHVVPPASRSAVRWCVSGAMLRALSRRGYGVRARVGIWPLFIRGYPEGYWVDLNDHGPRVTAHSRVLQHLDRFITQLEFTLACWPSAGPR